MFTTVFHQASFFEDFEKNLRAEDSNCCSFAEDSVSILAKQKLPAAPAV